MKRPNGDNYLLTEEVVLAMQLLGLNSKEQTLELKPRGYACWTKLIDSVLFRQNFPPFAIHWKLVGSKLKHDGIWFKTTDEVLIDFDSLFSIKDYWKKKFPDSEETVFESGHFIILLDSSQEFRSALLHTLLQYLQQLVVGKLWPKSNELRFDRQFQIVQEYLLALAKVQQTERLVLTEDHIKKALENEDVILRDRDYSVRLPEILWLMQMTGGMKILYSDMSVDDSGCCHPKITIQLIQTTPIGLDQVYSALHITERRSSNYSYDKATKTLTLRTDQGKPGMIHFWGAEKEMRLIETLLSLWEEDNKGIYSKEDVLKRYQELGFGIESPSKLSNIASKIRTKRDKDPVATKLLVIKVDYLSVETGQWTFKILTTAN